MFSSLHTDATLILMEELEKAGVTGYVGKVNMDRNGSPELQETTEQVSRNDVDEEDREQNRKGKCRKEVESLEDCRPISATKSTATPP